MNHHYFCKECGEKLRMVNPTYLICDNSGCERWDVPTTPAEAVERKDAK